MAQDHFGDIMGLETEIILHGNYSALERIILTANGNLQRIFSAYFNEKVLVKVERNDFVIEGDILKIDRMVVLLCRDKELCTAKSSITVNDSKFIDLLQSGKVGIGQLFRYIAALSELFSKPVYQDHLLPSTTTDAHYHIQTDKGTMLAEFKHFTDQPAINICNIPSITKVDCQNDQMVIKFDSPENAIEAHHHWSQAEDLILMMNHEFQCKNNRTVQSVAVKSIVLQDDSLRIDSEELDHNDVFFNSYEINLQQTQPVWARKEKRGLIRHKEYPDEETTSSTRSHDFKFDINYKDGEIVKRNLSVVNARRFKIHCLDCYNHGSLNIGLYLKTHKRDVQKYNFTIDGVHKQNMDMEVFFGDFKEALIIHFTMAAVPLLNPYTIPGVLEFGPQLALIGSFSVSNAIPLWLRFGFENYHDFHFEISSDKGLYHPPTFVHRKSPVQKHKYFNATFDRDIGLGFHVLPAINLPIKLGGYSIFEIALDFDAGMGIEFRHGAGTKCINDVSDYTMYSVFSFNFDLWVMSPIFHRRHTFWTSPIYPVNCPFCAKCNATNPERAFKEFVSQTVPTVGMFLVNSTYMPEPVSFPDSEENVDLI